MITLTKEELRGAVNFLPGTEKALLFGRSLLSDTAILRHMELGNIVIDSFNPKNLGTCNYDVTLGEWFFREHDPGEGEITTYNPWSERDVKRVWGEPQVAESARRWMDEQGCLLENIGSDDKIIWIRPNETILAHTSEFIGGRRNVTTMMKARSTLGRNFIEICKCAGWGDVGFTNRWTMEITNNSRHYQIPLVVGRRVAQIVFFEVEPIQSLDYTGTGKYQTSGDVETLKAEWSPSAMLPKMYKDREIRRQP